MRFPFLRYKCALDCHNNGDSEDRQVSHIHKLSFITMDTARTDGSHSHIHKLRFITMETARTDESHIYTS